MKQQTKHSLTVLLLLALLPLLTPLHRISAQEPGELLMKVAEKAKEKEEEKKEDEEEKKEEDSYQKLIQDATTEAGFMTLHLKKGKVYAEIPLSLLKEPMLFSGRVAQISNNRDVIAGQVPAQPKVVAWSKDDERLYLHEMDRRVYADPDASIYQRVHDNALAPILDAFKIKAWNTDSTAVVADISSLFLADRAPITAFLPASPFDALLGSKKLSGSYKKDLSSILGISAYPTNVNVRVRSVYTVDKEPFTAVITGGFLLLPQEPMKPRLHDARIGYFTDGLVNISTEEMNLDKLKFINRFRLEPRPQDVAKMKAGTLVEPKEPIIFYIDDAFPAEWYPYLKEGVEDWQEAFEAAGFKNAILAKPFPKNNPDFDPSDARFNCIIYSSSQTSNAMGPSWTDPRSGEILQASVYFYHNVLELLQSWRFVQTSAADPNARALNYDIRVLGPMLRYLIAHEVGHTLGLMHNMGASSAYTTEQLRSPSFTKKWGTTPSIMDYARYNYVAQPGDGVKNFLPPRLGVYDIYAIKWGYKPIFSAKTPKEELPTLRKWIQEKANDRRYHYGPQQVLITYDPYSQTEDLGDDAMEASRLGINNLKVTVNHLFEWTAEKGEDYAHQARLLDDIHRQFERYMGHCLNYIGGYQIHQPVQGDGKPAVTPIPKAKQKEALHFIIDESLKYPYWIATDEVKEKLAKSETDYAPYMGYLMSALTSNHRLGNIAGTSELANESERYTQEEFLTDLHNRVWQTSNQLTTGEKSMQYFYVESLLKALELTGEKKSSRRDAPEKVVAKGHLFNNLLKAAEVTAERKTSGTDAGHYALLHHLIQQALAL